MFKNILVEIPDDKGIHIKSTGVKQEEEKTGDTHTMKQITKSRRIRKRLEEYAIETLTFMYDFAVESYL